MANLGRKLARTIKRSTPEGKEEIKQEQAEKKAALPPLNTPVNGMKATGHTPQTQVRQRRSGNA